MPDRTPDQALPRWRLDLIAARLWEGAVIAYPTEGVWGLGCVPTNEEAVARLLAMKDRPWDMGLIMVAANVAQLMPFLEGLNDALFDELDRTWPGPVTYLVPDNGTAPMWVKGQHSRVALRVPDHPIVSQLCTALDAPLVSTSANPTGRAAARSALRVRQYFGKSLDLVVPGQLGDLNGASEIRDLVTGEVIRGRTR
ncbi:MAG: Sua5/YciO/YrdC/YwlC family protein [Proteobacteria bacterium]|nr:Sua5/YciO/YrdC/YwlC family protein [Pseudomonadota bacterium]